MTLCRRGVTVGVTQHGVGCCIVKEPYTPSHEIAYCMGLIVGEGCFSGTDNAPSLIVGLHE